MSCNTQIERKQKKEKKETKTIKLNKAERIQIRNPLNQNV